MTRKPLNLTFERNQKIAIVGANGIGKSTLLKSLLGIIPPLGGSVERGEYLELGYFEQEVAGGNRQTRWKPFGMPFQPLTRQKYGQPWLVAV